VIALVTTQDGYLGVWTYAPGADRWTAVPLARVSPGPH
jgi:uncharacterized membrane protein YoaT (DUF817 family)